MQNPGAKSGLLRNPAANNQGKFMTLAQFLDFAKNSRVSGILISIEVFLIFIIIVIHVSKFGRCSNINFYFIWLLLTNIVYFILKC